MSMAVELWAMQLERPLTAEETEVLTALLPSGRRARLERIRDAARRQEPLCAYFILRRAVWEQYHWQELPPLALTGKGKPYFPDIPAVHFSISHTNGAVLAALSAAPVGVDVERLRPVGERVMRRLADTQDPAVFFAHWVQREAMTKQNGMGVGASLHREPAAEAGVCCQMLDLFPGYAAAVASEESVGSLRRYTLESLLEPWMQERSIT